MLDRMTDNRLMFRTLMQAFVKRFPATPEVIFAAQLSMS